MMILCDRKKYSRRGFTLIELLVVIAVIAVLAAILLAVIGPARERVDLAKCANSLRSLYVTNGVYMLDNRSQYPPVHAKDHALTYWRRSFLQYEGLPSDSAKYLAAMSKTSFVCPSVGDFLAESDLPDTFISYAINDYLHQLNSVNVRDPAKCLFAMDAGIRAGNLPTESVTPALLRRIGNNYHNDSVNLIFADGHVELFGDVTLLTSASYNVGGSKDIWTP
ncbi:type II secretion system protein [Coraliomargarita sp. SDUM461004]|uniref:Type II secretion system protein n=1 Tax=Thalassobacterium sedimentorum TaxID=3041258 RepID=A0ABU1AJ19_9BACT|nr:type II secretion system protein [Coraliomargarita sp. SDUM461004]MDQ8194790.1 type II secretion system protein [Coraliomargarita sp. SDUM461004]